MNKLKAFLMAALLAVGVSAQAEVVKVHTKGQYAYASYYTYDGCSYESTYVSASEMKDPGTSNTLYVYAGVYKYNYCTGSYQYGYGYTTADPADLKVAGNKATIKTTVPLNYYYGGGVGSTLTIDLTFIANGEWTSQGHSNYHYDTPTYRYMSRYVGSDKSADVTGSVSDGTTEFAVGASMYGYIGKSNSGYIQHTQ